MQGRNKRGKGEKGFILRQTFFPIFGQQNYMVMLSSESAGPAANKLGVAGRLEVDTAE